MNKKYLWLFSILLIVSLACSFKGAKSADSEQGQSDAVPTVGQPADAQVEPTQNAEVPPTQEAQSADATQAPESTQEVAAPANDSYTEEFDGDTASWYTWVTAGDASKNFTATKPGVVSFLLPSQETYAYFANEAFDYGDVYVEAQITAKVFGDNGMAVVCRATDMGWYELRIHTTGMYAGSFEVYRYDQNLKDENKNPYVNVMKNIPRINSVNILNGSKSNIIGLSCVGNAITPIINGVAQTLPKEEPITDDVLTSGQVGVGGMSFGNGNVELEVEYVKVEAK
jgi:hypothetical protein